MTNHSQAKLQSLALGQEPNEHDDLSNPSVYARCLNWYQYHWDRSKAQSEIIKFYKNKKSPEEIKILESINHNSFTVNDASICRMVQKGLAVPEDSFKRTNDNIDLLIKKNPIKPEPEKIEKAYRKYSVKLEKAFADIDDAIDLLYAAEKNSFNIKEYVLGQMFNQSELSALHDRYSGELSELEELFNDKTPDLVEAYRSYAKSHLNKIRYFFRELVELCAFKKSEMKSQRAPRKKKAIPIAKILKNFRYKQSDETLGIVSFNPEDILKASVVWIYNTKYNTVGYYKTSDKFKINRLSIEGFETTGFKKVKKPKEFLEEFKSSTPAKRFKVFEKLKTKEYPGNGRSSTDIILLAKA